jgi:hypothetical protein
MIISILHRLVPAGVVDVFPNSASAEVDLFLSDDLDNLRLFLLKKFWFSYQ